MLPYMAYRYVKNKREKNQREMDSDLDSMVRSIVPDKTVICVPNVAAKLGEDSKEYIPGTLSIVEKSSGVFIEWKPSEDAETSWVMTSDDGNTEMVHARSPEEKQKCGARVAFSMDVNDLSSFRNDEPKRGSGGFPSIRLICRDGSSQVPLFFKNTTTAEFLDRLQGYITLRRSHRDSHLVIVVDQKSEALAKSVSMLDENGDILSRFMQNPYMTAMTGFSKITSFVQDQVIPSVLNDTDAVTQEEKIRLMRELRLAEEQMRVHSDAAGEFEVVTQLELPPRPEIYRELPVSKDLWNSFKLSNGSYDPMKLHHLKMNVFRGGLNAELRKEAWKCLLGYRQWHESDTDFQTRRAELAKQYENMKKQWMSVTEDQEKRFTKFVKRKSLVEKDVARTDRTVPFFQGDDNVNLVHLHNVLMTYVMYNFDLGYVQGMSDFASPLLFVMKDEVDTFWCFVGLMELTQKNFETDQAFIKLQMNQLRDLVMIINPKLANYLESEKSDDMYFCFRWVLVWFKREFSFLDTCKLWEVLWSGQPCPRFLLLICVAILDSQTNIIIDNQFGLTEILKHINDLSMHLKVDEILTAAEAIFHQLSASQNKLPAHICQYLNIGESAVSSSNNSPSKSDPDRVDL
ncbi:TBC1 domain family member 15 [Caenorhabditis elegans]|uniref:TBC1 domain family member 15 n=1 Tax=Caenorhabditis elegans TaxID=6239 RepID=A0A168H1X0_CAEEL|nr:Rab-GAP TBC domain-containing protein [Caenorhabditis elegans]SAP35530.1 Rab-GAP TBC domain-containing protein [Caenorhabditis elegans]|eukprot:NP_001317775.1 TBC (Tre-2/Bub2/Cdc16) domain family [Caenorhabditis elegans]